jgi:hypothetical protein
VDEDPSNQTDRDADEPVTGRRELWSHRIAIALLVAFAAFVILNVAVVIALLLRNLAPGGGPLGT